MDLQQFFDLDDRPIYNTQAVVRMTGVHAPRLRAWERRYAFVAPHRNTNKYRQYSSRDIAIIRWLRDQVVDGMTISQATSLLRTLLVDPSANHPYQIPVAIQHQQTTIPSSPDNLTDALIGAAMQLDQQMAYQTLMTAFAMYTVEDVCSLVMIPALMKIGDVWKDTPQNIIVEHFLSGMIRAQLDSLLHAAPMMTHGQTVLVGTVPGEMHEIGALMTALFLRRTGIRAVYVGQNPDASGLIMIARAQSPVTICLSITMPVFLASAVLLLQDLASIPHVQVFIGGQAITSENIAKLPSSVTPLPNDLRHTVEILRKALPAS